ncbi:MAG TPA: tRNA lysidine(34) synthetase TilS [Chloroflexota bacterium]
MRLPDLFTPGSKLVVGFSGGQDSTCLLHALVHSRRGLHVTAAHVDHALRADSAESARRVADSAAALGVACVVRRVDVGAYRAGLPGWSVQQAARAARYQALASVVREQSAAALLVAHTADDQAETLLLNLVRGAGLQGLAGMRLEEVIDVRRLGPPAPGLGTGSEILRLARPLLKVPRATTLAYCTQLGLTIVEDASNQTRTFTRNRVRLDLLPALETFNPAIRSVLARAADLVAEDLAALEAVVVELDAGLRRDHRYDLRRWRAQPRALQRRLLRRGIESLVGELTDVRAAPVDDALDVLQTGQANQSYHLPYGVEMIVERDSFSLRLHGRARHRERPNTWEVEAPRV